MISPLGLVAASAAVKSRHGVVRKQFTLLTPEVETKVRCETACETDTARRPATTTAQRNRNMANSCGPGRDERRRLIAPLYLFHPENRGRLECGQLLPNTSFDCCVTRMNVVRFESSRSRRAP